METTLHDRLPFPGPGRRRGVRGRTDVPHPFLRQIDVAARIAPVEAVRGHAGLLLACGDAPSIGAAEDALRETWLLDAVHVLALPVPSWAAAGREASGTRSGLQRWVMREVQERDPSLVALLVGPETDAAMADALVAMLRGWGCTVPLAVLVARADGDVRWLVAPRALFDLTG